jgi:uncharacterized protein (DUF58 family)
MARLDRLDVVSRKVLLGKLKGERRSKRRGQSVEFADYRNYVVGDDLRRIDWNLFARLDKFFLRLFMEEEDLSVSVLVDATASMAFGEPEKLHYAKQVAASLGYIGLANHNRVNVYSFTSGIEGRMEGMRGKRPLPQMLNFINQIGTTGPAKTSGNLGAALKHFALSARGKGLVVVISDFLDKGDLKDALKYLPPDRFDAYALHLLCPQEIDPEKAGVVGDVRLVDSEDEQVEEVSVSGVLLERYRATLRAFCEHVKQVCVDRGMVYLAGDTSVPFDDLVLHYMRERGLLG